MKTTTMIVEFDNIKVTINNPEVAKRVKKYILGVKKKADRPKANKPWTETEEEMLLSLYNSGASVRDIANELGRTKPAISVRLHRSLSKKTEQQPIEEIEL